MRTLVLIRTTVVLVLGCSFLTPLEAQKKDRCLFLCRPELKIEPTFTVENLFSRHRVAEFEGDQQVRVTRAQREVVFETIVALDIPTEIPRVSFTFETIFIPMGYPLHSGDPNILWLGSRGLGVPVGDDRSIRRWVHGHCLLHKAVEEFSPAA